MVCFYLQEIFMILNIYDEIGLFKKNIYIYIYTYIYINTEFESDVSFTIPKI